jgi:cysteine-rich repeat protein
MKAESVSRPAYCLLRAEGMRFDFASVSSMFLLALTAGCAAGVRAGDAYDGDSSFSAPSPGVGTNTAGGGGDSPSGSGGSSGAGGAGAGGGANMPQPIDKCGDALVDAAEECDDGNTVDGDGCSGCLVDCDGAELKHPVTNHCYRLVKLKAHWQAAESDCNVWGGAAGLGKLVSIQSKFEQELVQNLGSGHERWIGATDAAIEGQFAWSDGSPFGYDNWRSGEPNNKGNNGGEEDCAEIEGDGQWDDQPCEKTKYYICERRAAGVP